MPYEPEILIADDPRVLQEIRNPETMAVSWNAVADNGFLSAISCVDSFAEAAQKNSFLESAFLNPYSLSKRAANSGLDTIVDEMMKRVRPFEDIALRMGYSSIAMAGVRFYPRGDNQGDIYIPHRDQSSLTMVFSFNAHMSSTFCVPAEFTGEATGQKGQLHFYRDANLEEAESFPGLSVSIIKDKQVHYAPVPSDWRCAGYFVSVENSF